MNAYLSREEKENFIQATALAAQLEATIDGYSKAKSTNPEFLKYLRMGRTMIAKALTMRVDALEAEAKVEFAKQASKIQAIFVPTLEAKKAYQEIAAIKTTLPMSVQDFEDWYCAVIETTCKRCCTEQYTECLIRSILTKYGVYPIDPSAQGKCQYSYVGTPEAEELQQVAADTVSAEIYNMAVSELASTKIQVANLEEQLAEYDQLKTELLDILYLEDDRPENPSLDELIACIKESFHNCETQDQEQMGEIHSLRGQVALFEEKLDIANAALTDLQQQSATVPEIELPASTTGQLAVSLGMTNGNCLVYDLPEYMTRVLVQELHQASRRSRGICASHVDGDLIAVDMSEVVVMRVANAPADLWTRNQPQEAPQRPQPEKTPAAVPTTDTGERERYRVECKCGVEYFCSMNVGRTKARCRECNTPVFADRLVSPILDPVDGVEATLLTNRYWVEKEPYPDSRQENPGTSISNNYGRDYKDPCDPMAG